MSLLGDLGTAIKNKLGGTSVDNTVPIYNGTTCTLQGSSVTISDTNVVTASGGFVGSLTGNASTATKLQTARTINGVAFDGTANITVSDSTAVKLTDDQTIAGVKTFSSSPIVPTPTTGTQVANKYYADTKVSKVTSTDNAVVRFNGTVGEVQNSGVIIDDSNNVGIGVSSPSAPLEVATKAGINAGVRITQGISNATNAILQFTDNPVTKQLGAINVANDSTISIIGNTERMRITSPGNLLVGTTTDNGVDKLQVNGSISASNKLVYQSNIVGTFTGGEWYDTGVSTNTLGYNILDTFAITVLEDSYLTGNGNYSMSYKFIVGSASLTSNSSNTFNIPTLSAVGHANNGGIVALRWQLVLGNLPPKIQFKVTHTSTFDSSFGKNLNIYVTKLI